MLFVSDTNIPIEKMAQVENLVLKLFWIKIFSAIANVGWVE